MNMNKIDDILHNAALRLNRKTPELESEELTAFVSSFLERRSTFLDICSEHGSPLYIIDENTVRQRADQFTSAFRKEIPGIDIYYAMKSNNHPYISKILAGAGLGLDVSSGMELQTALAANADRIVFSGPGKSEKELIMAVNNRDRVTILMDSFHELEKLEKISASMNASIRAGIRVTTKAHGIWRKFGIPLSDLPRFIALAAKCRNVNFCGLQSHVSWNMNPDRQVEFIKTLAETLKTLTAEQKSLIEFIDLGGGFWPPQGEWLQEAGTEEGHLLNAITPERTPLSRHFKQSSSDISLFASAIGEAVNNIIYPLIKCRICLEPGRWICNDTMHILITVADKKAGDLLITDAGTNAIGWDRFETDYSPVINLTHPATEEHECLVMGALCTPHDLWGYSYFGTCIENGDVLLIPYQGAYTFSLKQNFIKPLPEVVTIQPSGKCVRL